MAAASVQPSPRFESVMAGRRVPLANNPNAANSPFRGVHPVAGKRTRAQANDPRELLQGQPPLKKQLLDLDNDENLAPRSFTRHSLADKEAERQLFMKKPGNAPMTAFEKKLVAAREKKTPAQVQSVEASPDKSKKVDSLENIRQWQRHYRKAFPAFVFYFESVPEDIRKKMSVHVQQLGAKEEKFFSKSVTHVVTTRPIPPEHANKSPEDPTLKQHNGHRTIDPSLLDQTQDSYHNDAQRRTANLLDTTLQSRLHSGTQFGSQHMDPRKSSNHGADMLTRARELGIKIWALEKLQRMMLTMYNAETGEQPLQGTLTRSHATANLVQRQGKEADLQRLLRNEKITGPADRDLAVVTQDMCQFKGYYLYVHDMDEKVRPVMVRDYSAPKSKEQGKWPQFRLSASGRCPFIEDPAHAKKIAQEEQRAAIEAKEREAGASATRARTRAAAAATNGRQTVLGEVQPNVRRSPRKQAQEKVAKPLDPPTVPASRQNSADGMPALFGSAQASIRGMPRFIGGEPAASGVQPSNITSAIRSQIISSTAISSTAPGARVGTSKEIHALKRKVLERGASVTSGQTMSSMYMNDVRAALNGDAAPPPRAAKRKAQETLGYIHEEPEDEDEYRVRKQQVRKATKVQATKDPKPGYCENCRDKFEDFDEHILSRKHRKFALTPDNWSQLDDLLGQLVRPRKDV